MIIHTCDNEICGLLNPCIDGLLPYQEVVRRVAEAEKSSRFKMKKFREGEEYITGPFDIFDWSTRHMIYQLPNTEFIHELSSKIRNIGAKKILEVGAGRGVVCRHISKILNQDITLTDSYGWWEHNEYVQNIEYADVLKRTYMEAIEEFEPDLIIASWIPYNECWTKDFRKYPFVKGYILIGEGRGCATGSEDDWHTDWNMQDWEDVSKYGICKTDHGFHMDDGIFKILHTDVTYFERPGAQKEKS